QREIIGEAEVVDEHFEGAFAGAVVELGSGRIEGTRAVAGSDVEHIWRGDVEDLGVRIDEATDEPGAGDAVGLRASASNPFHGRVSFGGAAGSWRGRPGRLR